MANRFKNDKTLPTVDNVRWELIQEAMGRCNDSPYHAGVMIGMSGRTVIREIGLRGLPYEPVKQSHATKAVSVSQIQRALREAAGNVEQASVTLGYRDGGRQIRSMIKDGRIKP